MPHYGGHGEHKSRDSERRSGNNQEGSNSSHSLKNYSIWVANPVSYVAQTPEQDPKSPHITLKLTDGTNSPEADINVKSTSKDTRLVYWVNNNFQHPITQQLASLPLGQTVLKPTNGEHSKYALDFIRTTPALLDLNAGTILPASGNNTIEDKLEPILTQAINQKAKVYLWGQGYNDSNGESGIHDIHMNQGNTGNFSNDVFSDGSFMVQFEDHWEAVFLAFADQEVPTDDETGDPTDDAKAFDETLSS
ncbi:unnamed protein product [Aureobasidium vineae]|uniref:DUF2278 family protein n=1 Tax=Aureobasidium vineae TaxID=2773715 RepID=A0A9N8PG89_9PEZI|nr:unnamed protein product [Aureobasidium vineae]